MLVYIPFGKKGGDIQLIAHTFNSNTYHTRTSKYGWSLPPTPYHHPSALPLPKVVLDITLSAHIPIPPNSHTGSPYNGCCMQHGVSTVTLYQYKNE